jgi:hypothetical protein
MMRIPDRLKRNFIKRHRLLFKRATDNVDAKVSIALLARKELGYSEKTAPVDILRGLENALRRA